MQNSWAKYTFYVHKQQQRKKTQQQRHHQQKHTHTHTHELQANSVSCDSIFHWRSLFSHLRFIFPSPFARWRTHSTHQSVGCRWLAGCCQATTTTHFHGIAHITHLRLYINHITTILQNGEHNIRSRLMRTLCSCINYARGFSRYLHVFGCGCFFLFSLSNFSFRFKFEATDVVACDELTRRRRAYLCIRSNEVRKTSGFVCAIDPTDSTKWMLH